MTTRVEELDGKFVVTFSGELDTAAAAETEKALAPVLENLGKDIVFVHIKMKHSPLLSLTVRNWSTLPPAGFVSC